MKKIVLSLGIFIMCLQVNSCFYFGDSVVNIKNSYIFEVVVEKYNVQVAAIYNQFDNFTSSSVLKKHNVKDAPEIVNKSVCDQLDIYPYCLKMKYIKTLDNQHKIVYYMDKIKQSQDLSDYVFVTNYPFKYEYGELKSALTKIDNDEIKDNLIDLFDGGFIGFLAKDTDFPYNYINIEKHSELTGELAFHFGSSSILCQPYSYYVVVLNDIIHVYNRCEEKFIYPTELTKYQFMEIYG